MSQFSIERSTRASRVAGPVALVLLLALAAAPLWAGRDDLQLLAQFFLYLALASLWNLLAGYAGLVSVGQQAFVGFGGYMLFLLTIFAGLSPLAAVPIAALLGALIAVPVAALLFRLRGAYFAIGSWVMAEVFRLTFAQISALGGGSGRSLPVAVIKSLSPDRSLREWLSYWLALAAAVLVLATVAGLLRSRIGLALTAIRDNELAARSVGIDITRTKILVYVLAGALTSFTGALIFLQKLRISPDAAFSVNDWTAFVIFIVVIGGTGTVEGPILGTLIFFALRESLADLGATYLIVLGGVAIVVMLTASQGLWGLIRARTGLRLLPLGYHVTQNGEKGA